MPVIQVPAGEEGGPRALKNLLKEEQKEEYDEEKKEDDDEEEEMEKKKRDEEDMKNRLMVEEGMIVKFSLVYFATCVLPLQLLLQGFFFNKKLNNYIGETYVVPPQAPDQLPLTTLLFARTVQPLWQDLLKKFQPV